MLSDLERRYSGISSPFLNPWPHEREVDEYHLDFDSSACPMCSTVGEVDRWNALGGWALYICWECSGRWASRYVSPREAAASVIRRASRGAL